MMYLYWIFFECWAIVLAWWCISITRCPTRVPALKLFCSCKYYLSGPLQVRTSMKPLARGPWVISNWWGSFFKNNNSIQTFFFFHHHHVNTLSSSFCGDFKFITAFFYLVRECSTALMKYFNTFSLQNITLHVHVRVVLSVNLFSVLRNDFFVNPFVVDYTNNHWVITRLSKGVQIWTLTRKVRDGLLPSWDLNDGNGSGSCSNNPPQELPYIVCY